MASSKESCRLHLDKAELEKVRSAVENGNCSELVKYIKRGWDVDQELNPYGTALHCAAWEGHTEVARVLCEAGANVNKQDVDGWTPLHRAVVWGHTQTVKCLVEHNATVDVRNKVGMTPLHYAALRGHTQTVKCLVEHNATVDVRTREGHTPLHWAAEEGRTAIVQCLVEHRAKVNVRDENGDTTLHLASQSGKAAVVELLVNKGSCEVTAVNKGGNTLLHSASSHGKLAVVKLLLKMGVDPTVVNKGGRTAYDVCGHSCNVFFKEVDDETIEKIKKVLEKHMRLKQQSGKSPQSDEDPDENLVILLGGLEGYLKSKRPDIPVGELDVSVKIKKGEDGTFQMLSVDTKLMDYFPLVVPVRQSCLLGKFPEQGQNVISAELHESLANALKSVVLLARADAQGVGSGFRVGRNYVITNYHVYQCLNVPIGCNAALFHYNKPLIQSMGRVVAVPIKQLVAHDPGLDVAVLELDLSAPLPAPFNHCKPVDVRSPLPPPLSRFKAIVNQEHLHFAGHPDGDQKVVEIHCRVAHMEPGEFQRTVSELNQWAQRTFPGRAVFLQIDDPRRVLYRTSLQFGKGSSGSPGFVPDDKHEACVAAIQTRGFPDLPDFHFVSQEVVKARSVEQGVRVEAVYDFLHTNHPALCQDIFGNNKPS